MGERKVLNKYYPPDFDPSLLRKFGYKKKWDPFKQIEVRMMLPFNIQCSKCGEYMYRGKKFNSKKEDVHGEDYLGIKKFRFYMKCCVCSSVFSIKTDPENADYETELNCKRLFEVWKQKEKDLADDDEERLAEEAGDSMKALENRTIQQKREMDVLDALELNMAQNDRNSGMDPVAILAAQKKADAEAKEKILALTEADEEETKKAFGKDAVDRLDKSPERDTGKWANQFKKKTSAAPAAVAAPPPICTSKLKKKKKKKKKKKRTRDAEEGDDAEGDAAPADAKKTKVAS